MNVYFDPELLKQVESLSLRRKVSKSAIVEAAVASFLSGDSAEQLEAAMSRRLDRLGRQVDGLDEDLAVLGETLSLFIRFWLTITPPLPEGAQASARAKGIERFEGFMQSLGRKLATGDRFLKELSRDIDSLGDNPSQDQSEANSDRS
jgi:hypothetical protein